MKKIIIQLIILFVSFIVNGQKYPVKTKLKEDSVVILTTDQYQVMQTLLDNQKKRVTIYKKDLLEQEKEIDSIINDLIVKNLIIDSLLCEIENKSTNLDSITSRLVGIENWIYNSSIDNTYLYYSYREQQVIGIDFASFILIGNRRSGNFSLVRRGPTYEDEQWKKYNRLYLNEPPENWETYYKKNWKPNLVIFPYKIKPTY